MVTEGVHHAVLFDYGKLLLSSILSDDMISRAPGGCQSPSGELLVLEYAVCHKKCHSTHQAKKQPCEQGYECKYDVGAPRRNAKDVGQVVVNLLRTIRNKPRVSGVVGIRLPRRDQCHYIM